jgi:AcrR family transcriptional regulator
MTTPEQIADDTVDGRRLRRRRNREAIIEALLAFYAEGNADPSAAEVSERAGLSARSLFRHFDDLDDLCHSAFARQFAVVEPLMWIEGFGTGEPTDKARSLARQRIRVHEAVGNVMRIARAKAVSNPVVAEHLAANRARWHNQLVLHLHDELVALRPHERRETLAALDALLSFETWDMMRRDSGLARGAVESALVRAVTAVISTASPVADR